MTETPEGAQTPAETIEVPLTPTGQADPPEAPSSTDEPESDTFPRSYVEQLRTESAEHRVAAASANERAELAVERLYDAVRDIATGGLLRDPSDLPEGEYLDGHGMPDAAKMREAAEWLVQAKPHLARPRGSLGQGKTGPQGDPVSLGSILRGAAR